MVIELPEYRQVSLSVRLNTVLFPFDAGQYASALSENGYIIDEQLETIPGGTLLKVTGTVGRKANAVARLDMNRYIIGVHAPELETAVEEFELYEHIIASAFDLSVDEISLYYEFLTSLTIKANRNPVECFQKHFEGHDLIAAIGSTIDSDVSLYGVRISPSGGIPNKTDWFDIRVEPRPGQASTHYSINVVWRHSDRGVVFGFIKRFDEVASSIIDLIEKT